MDHDLWRGLGTSEAGLQKLRDFAALTEKWTVKINLISRGTISDIWSRHIEDSARIAVIAPKDVKLWADFGSGGGFPGIVLAVILSDRGDQTRFVLVESDQRKATFLREAARQLKLPVEVRAERAEAIESLGADVVSARALAALEPLCAVFERHGLPDGLAIFPKGETWEKEVVEARKNWSFVLEATPDPGHKGSAILQLRSLSRAGRDAHA